MPKTRFSIEPHGRKRLEVSRNLSWSEIVVRLDGVELGRTDREGIFKGLELELRDHTVLRLWTEHGPNGAPFLFATRNGHPLPGSAGDPHVMLWTSLGIFWGIAALQISFAVMVIHNNRADEVIYWNLAAGLVLALLGILAWRRSLAAMVIASVLCFGEIAIFLVTQGNITVWNAWRLVFALGILGWMLKRGIVAVRDLNATRLPIRHRPEPMHHAPLQHHAGPHDGLS